MQTAQANLTIALNSLHAHNLIEPIMAASSTVHGVEGVSGKETITVPATKELALLGVTQVIDELQKVHGIDLSPVFEDMKAAGFTLESLVYDVVGAATEDVAGLIATLFKLDDRISSAEAAVKLAEGSVKSAKAALQKAKAVEKKEAKEQKKQDKEDRKDYNKRLSEYYSLQYASECASLDYEVERDIAEKKWCDNADRLAETKTAHHEAVREFAQFKAQNNDIVEDVESD